MGSEMCIRDRSRSSSSSSSGSSSSSSSSSSSGSSSSKSSSREQLSVYCAVGELLQLMVCGGKGVRQQVRHTLKYAVSMGAVVAESYC